MNELEVMIKFLQSHGYSVRKLSRNTPKTNETDNQLLNFDSLPDSAHVRVPVVAALRGCTVNTVWRHVKLGLVPAPKKLGPQITAWNVGELREYMKRQS